MFSSNDPSRTGIANLIGVTPLRLGTALVLLYQHVWSQIPLAFQALWNAKAWAMIDLFTKAGLPFSKFLALLTVAVAALISLGWLLGFLTRVCAFLLIPIALGSLIVCNRNGIPSGSEISLLYFFIAITVACSGPGWLSLDALFRRRSRSSKKLRYNF
ncbi:MAG: DoxX family protein [Verrucomicrobia bacterium]|nr:DoxX family protein [Verrucomicrobiota bacterium]